MSRESHDKCGKLIDTEEDNPLEERTRIAEVGAAALYKLNGVMKQMKDWREDRERLRRNIRQLKTALLDAGRVVADAPLYSDSFLEHRRNEVKRLKNENEALKNELAEIKAAMKDAKIELLTGNLPAFLGTIDTADSVTNSYPSSEDIGGEYMKHVIESLKSRLVEFTIGDQNVEILLVNVLGKAAEAIANLCEEVVNVTENLHTTKYNNADLHSEVDKLKAMLRSRTGNRANYKTRFNELGNLSKELKNHINIYKRNKENETWNCSMESSTLLVRVEELVNNLKNRLEHDREALVAAGDPDCLMYLKKVTELRINLSCLQYGLSSPRTNGHLQLERSTQEREAANKAFTLTNLLKEIDTEIYKLRDQNLLKHYWMNNFDSGRYLSKVEEMERIVRNALAAISSLKSQSYVVAKPSCNRSAETLDELVGKLCGEIKELEMIVLSQDSASLFRRIEELEESVVRLKGELTEKDERANSLEEKFSNTRLALEQKIKELEDTQRQIAVLTEENKTFREKTKATEERMLGLLAEFETDRKQMTEVRQVNCDLKKKLCSYEADKESLQNEIKNVRATLREKENEIENILNEHNAKEKANAAELENLLGELHSSQKENEKLKGKIQEVTSVSEAADRERTEELIQTSKIELHRLRIELDQSRRSLDSANCEIIDLQTRLDHSGSDRKRLEENFARLESDRKTLLHQLEAEKATSSERLEESRKLISKNNQLQSELSRVQKEADHARQIVTKLQTEKEQLQKLTKDLNNKWTSLMSNSDQYKFECKAVQQELSNTKTTLQDLARAVENGRVELNTAVSKIQCLESENARLHDNLDALTLNSREAETRLQVLLTENNDLATRIKELNEANVTLRDQLNKAREENEYFSIELHKSRAENDKARSEFVLLQDTSAQILKRSNIRLRRTGDKLRERINELENARGTLEDQLKTLRARHEMVKRERECLYRENGTLKDYTNKFNRLGKIGRTKEGQLVIISNAILRDDVNQDDKHTETEIRTNERERRIIEHGKDDRGDSSKPECEAAKIIGRRRVAPKRLRVENDALKFEMTNLRAQNTKLKLELSEAKVQLERMHAELTGIKEYTESIRPISNKLEMSSLYYKQELSTCPTENTVQIQDSVSNALAIPTVSDMKSLYDSSQAQWYLHQEGGTLLRHIKQLEIQNIALIKENASLRSYVFVALTDREKAENSLQNAMDEILALRAELRKLREERDLLRARLDTGRTELDKLTSEKIAMKDEFITLRNEIVELRQRTGELRCDYQKLEETNAGLEESLMSTAKVVNKYTMNVGNFDGLRDQLKAILEQYLSPHDFLAVTER